MYVNVSGCKVYYEQAGSGKPLLLLHGWGVSCQAFRPLFMRLAEYRDVRAIDFPGFGLSAPPPSAWGTPEYAEMLEALIGLWGIKAPDILAHSFGARVALQLAKKHPESAGSMVLTGAAGIRPKSNVPIWKQAVSRLGKTAGKFGPPGAWLKEKLYAKIASADYRNAGAMRPILVKVVNEDMRPILPDIHHRILLLWGEKDMDTRLEAGRIMNAGLDNSALVVMEGCGHYAFMDKPDEFYSHLKQFWALG